MVLQLAGAHFRQYDFGTISGGKRNFAAPTPDQDTQPKEVKLYMESTWRSENMSLLEFLRKTNDDGEICGAVDREVAEGPRVEASRGSALELVD